MDWIGVDLDVGLCCEHPVRLEYGSAKRTHFIFNSAERGIAEPDLNRTSNRSRTYVRWVGNVKRLSIDGDGMNAAVETWQVQQTRSPALLCIHGAHQTTNFEIS